MDKNYPTPEDKINCQVLNIRTKNENNPDSLEVKPTGSLDLTGFTNLKLLGCNGHKITKLNLKDCTKLENLQCWENELTELDVSNCEQLKRLGCSSNKLTNLDLTNCQQLEYLNCSKNQLTQLDLRKNKNLTELWCQQNQLTQIIFPPQLPNLEKLVCYGNLLTYLNFAVLDGEKLTVLSLSNNNFALRDLSYLSRFTNLEELHLSNRDWMKVRKGIYNRWTGSLLSLKNMKQLHTLTIDNTDLDSGIGYLPASVMEIHCSYSARPKSRVSLIVKELE